MALDQPCLFMQGRGEWVPTAAQARVSWYKPMTSRDAPVCTRPDRARRANAWRFRYSDQQCQLRSPPSPRSHVCNSLAARAPRVLLVGDSTARYIYIALVLLLVGGDGPPPSDPQFLCGDAELSQSKLLLPCRHRVCDGRVALEFLREDCPTCNTTRVPRELNRWNHANTVSKGQWMHELARNLTRHARTEAQPTLLLLFGGLHMWEHDLMHERIEWLGRALHMDAHRAQLLRLIYVTAIGGHDDCWEASRPLTSVDESSDADSRRFYCGEARMRSIQGPGVRYADGTQTRVKSLCRKYMWDLVNEWRPALVKAMRASFGGQLRAVLDASAIGALRPDLHLGRFNVTQGRRVVAKHEDCGHFCPNEPVYGTVALVLMQMVTEWGALD